jgi:hypothetical protein
MTGLVCVSGMNKWIKGVLVGAGVIAGVSATAQATTVYNVQSTSATNCTTGGAPAPHGLWTGQQNFSGTGCGNYYDISGIFTVNDDDADTNNWTGSFNAFAINPAGMTADIQLTFSNFAETGNYKKENGASYDVGTDTPDIDFFQGISGTIEIDSVTYTVAGFAGGYSFQWGPGGNAKDANEFGGSSWILMNGLSGHWDLNLTFAEPITNTEVPEPGLAAVFGLGLLGLGLARRRSRNA